MACAENPQLRFISCNTTEAGITYDPACRFEDRPASSYPGKLTQFLYHRFQTFGSQPGKGFLILACELIDDNGKELKNVLKYASQWNLGQDFIQWLQKENTFCSTLVDRIVTGFPRTEAPALNEEKRLRRQRHGHRRNLRLLGNRRPPVHPYRTPLRKSRPPHPRNRRPQTLQTAQSTHTQRSTHLHGTGEPTSPARTSSATAWKTPPSRAS